jgi:hypothetical protein
VRGRSGRGASGALGRTVGALAATGIVVLGMFGAIAAAPSIAGATSAGAVTYEADCTTNFESGQVAPFVTSLDGNTTVDTAQATGAKFGFTGTASTVLIGPFIANLFANGVGSNPMSLQWDETLGSSDGTATGTYLFKSPTINEADGGGASASNITWGSGSTTLNGNFSKAAVGDSVASTQAGLAATAAITAINGTTSATINLPTTAAATKADGASVGWGVTTTFVDTKLSTGNAFTTKGTTGGTTSVGLVSATSFTALGFLQFGGKTGDGAANCLLTGYTAGAAPGPGQTGGVKPPLETGPVLTPAGQTTPLVSVSPLVFPAAGTVALTSVPTAPGAPTNVVATSSFVVSVAFTAPATGGSPITKYTVTAIDSTTPANGGQTATGTSSPIVVTNLIISDNYTFTVTATNAVGTGPPSAPSNSIKPHGAAQAPSAPLDPVATTGNTRATVGFTTPASNGGAPITGYTATAVDSTTPGNGGQTAVGTTSPIVVTGLTNGDSYTFTVTATNLAGTSVPSVPTNSVTPVVPVVKTVPGPPTGVSASAGNASATVKWRAPVDDGESPIIGYVITSSGGSAVHVGAVTSDVFSGLSNGIAYTFKVAAINAVGEGSASAASNSVTPAAPKVSGGYWIVTGSGGVFPEGSATSYGTPASIVLNSPIVGSATTPDGRGYWLVAADGGIFAYGDAAFYGSMGGTHLNAPIVGMAATANGHGYWLVASDGGIFAFGNAAFKGSMGGTPLNKPVVGITTDGGEGYWLVASDGGVFSFGSAAFHGSTGGTPLNAPIAGIASTANGKGYWMVGADGGVFSFGDASFHGSASGATNGQPVVGIAASSGGYLLAAANGGVFAFGTPYYGSEAGAPLDSPVTSISA